MTSLPSGNPKRFVAPIRGRNLIWLPAIVGLALVVEFYGTPHLRVRATWSGSDADPFYHNCEYLGFRQFRMTPADGACPLILFAKAA